MMNPEIYPGKIVGFGKTKEGEIVDIESSDFKIKECVSVTLITLGEGAKKHLL